MQTLVPTERELNANGSKPLAPARQAYMNKSAAALKKLEDLQQLATQQVPLHRLQLCLQLLRCLLRCLLLLPAAASSAAVAGRSLRAAGGTMGLSVSAHHVLTAAKPGAPASACCASTAGRTVLWRSGPAVASHRAPGLVFGPQLAFSPPLAMAPQPVNNFHRTS